MQQLSMFFMILAAVLFFLGAFAWPPVIDSYRLKIVSAGLLAWVVSILIRT
jgi:hypothetical protein